MLIEICTFREPYHRLIINRQFVSEPLFEAMLWSVCSLAKLLQSGICVENLRMYLLSYIFG